MFGASPFLPGQLAQLPWKGEAGWVEHWPRTYQRGNCAHVALGTFPHNREGQTYFLECLQASRPQLIVLVSHPRLKGMSMITDRLHGLETWNWLANAAGLGAPVGCISQITVFFSKEVDIGGATRPSIPV